MQDLTKVPKKYQWRFDLSVCPDCKTVQKGEKDAIENCYCDNPDCECEVIAYHRKRSPYDGYLMWDNVNWG